MSCCADLEAPTNHKRQLGVEAAVKFGWERWLGDNGAFVGMTGFGASGPADALYRHFNITPNAIVAAALARL
jgi:transketolase